MNLVMPDSTHQRRVEIDQLAKHFFNKWFYYLTLILLITSLQATNIASIIISAQVQIPSCGGQRIGQIHSQFVGMADDGLCPGGSV